MSQATPGRILSIQSHVAYGYVGGKSAVFPLQCLGYDVDIVNTVNFSNHSGYGRFGGLRASAAELCRVFDLMEENGFLYGERLLTGYIPGAEALSAVRDLAARMRQKSPELIYLLDPVLGDAGKLYVAPDTVPIYRDALQYSTIITPNWFEVEVLTDVRISDLTSLRRALKVLHEDYHVPNVVISSIPLRQWLLDILPTHIRPHADIHDSDFLACIASAKSPADDPATSAVHAQCIPCLPGYFSGVGDLFSALVIGHYKQSNITCIPPIGETETPLSYAVSQALTKTHAILTLTHEYAQTLPEEHRSPSDEELDGRDIERKIRRMRGRELRVIQGQDIIRGAKPVEYRQLLPWTEFWEAKESH
ncbi:bud site selection protein 16 [Wolfiporia cocos MD-104 SS10]|uniref:pyridoxal kinase n=1 Tax=Wolfiporia cocos (strain MD-104) TaxID=742152 RepID=A0A2H3JFG8_WOLCO|nr:bud site selection protein 16 [Wolfiporia cocos MD-104 SS10]